MWMANTRLLTLAVILALVAGHYVWSSLPQDTTQVTASVQAIGPTESWDRPLIFELMDPETESDAPPVAVRESPIDQPVEEDL